MLLFIKTTQAKQSEEREKAKARQERLKEGQRHWERASEMSGRISLLETQLDEASDQMRRKDALVEALCMDLKLVQAAREAEHTQVQNHMRLVDKKLEEELSRSRQEGAEACHKDFENERLAILEELEASRKQMAMVVVQCDAKISFIKQQANSTAEDLRAQVRAMMEQEEVRELQESQRANRLQDLLHYTQVNMNGICCRCTESKCTDAQCTLFH